MLWSDKILCVRAHDRTLPPPAGFSWRDPFPFTEVNDLEEFAVPSLFSNASSFSLEGGGVFESTLFCSAPHSLVPKEFPSFGS